MRTNARLSWTGRGTAALLLAALAACGGSAPLQPAAAPSSILSRAEPGTTRTDPATVLQARIEGDLLVLDVRYGGGCREHRFALYRDDAFLESSPVQVHVRLAHDAAGDACRALVGRELTFDLAPLRNAYRTAYGDAGPLMIHLHAPGEDEAIRPSLLYRF